MQPNKGLAIYVEAYSKKFDQPSKNFTSIMFGSTLNNLVIKMRVWNLTA